MDIKKFSQIFLLVFLSVVGLQFVGAGSVSAAGTNPCYSTGLPNPEQSLLQPYSIDPLSGRKFFSITTFDGKYLSFVYNEIASILQGTGFVSDVTKNCQHIIEPYDETFNYEEDKSAVYFNTPSGIIKPLSSSGNILFFDGRSDIGSVNLGIPSKQYVDYGAVDIFRNFNELDQQTRIYDQEAVIAGVAKNNNIDLILRLDKSSINLSVPASNCVQFFSGFGVKKIVFMRTKKSDISPEDFLRMASDYMDKMSLNNNDYSFYVDLKKQDINANGGISATNANSSCGGSAYKYIYLPPEYVIQDILVDPIYAEKTIKIRNFDPRKEGPSLLDDIKVRLRNISGPDNETSAVDFGVVIKIGDTVVDQKKVRFSKDTDSDYYSNTFSGLTGSTATSVNLLDDPKNYEVVIKGLGEGKLLTFQLTDVNGDTMKVISEKMIPLGGNPLCAHVWGSGPIGINFMRGQSSKYTPEMFVNVVGRIVINGFNSVQPYSLNKDKFSYTLDLKNHNDSSWINDIKLVFYNSRFSKINDLSSCKNNTASIALIEIPSSKPYVGISAYPGKASFLSSSAGTSLLAIHEFSHAFVPLNDEYQYNRLGGALLLVGPTHNCSSNPADDFSFNNKLYGRKDLVPCTSKHFNRPSLNSLMNNMDAEENFDKYNIVDCAYILNEIKTKLGLGVTNIKTLYPICAAMGGVIK